MKRSYFASLGISAAVVFGLMMASSAAVAAAPANAPAGKPAAQPPDDPAKVAAARQFVLLYHPWVDPKNVSAQLDKTLPVMSAARKKTDPKLDTKKLEAETRARVMERLGRSLDLQSRVISRHFSLQELKSLTAFYASPLGRKLLAETPKIQNETREYHRKRGDGPGFKLRTQDAAPSEAKSAPAKPQQKK